MDMQSKNYINFWGVLLYKVQDRESRYVMYAPNGIKIM